MASFIVFNIILLILILVGIFISYNDFKNSLDSKRSRIYILIFLFAFSIIGILGAIPKSNPLSIYFLLSSVFLLLGLIHLFIQNKNISFAIDLDNQLFPLVFSAVLTLIGSILFSIVFFVSNMFFLELDGYEFVYKWTGFAFCLPIVLSESYKFWRSIPYITQDHLFSYNATYKVQIPTIHPNLPCSIFIRVKFDENLQFNEVNLEIWSELTLYEVFHLIAKEEHRGFSIQDLIHTEDKNTVSWCFYKKPTRWWKKTLYLNPKVSLHSIEIHPGDKIFAERFVVKNNEDNPINLNQDILNKSKRKKIVLGKPSVSGKIIVKPK